MQVAEKVVLNTIILYARIIISMLISLASVPIVLKALGANDYGLFNLVAGVIAMLAFLNASMTVSTQRYLSVAIGADDKNQLNQIFNAALLLHLLIGLIIVLIFEISGLFIFDGFLNILPERIPAAKIIFQALVISTFFTIISVPYGAVINAKENMLALSIIHIIKDVLKLLLALYIIHCSYDRLIIYGIGIAVISITNVIINRFFINYRYNEFSFHPRRYYHKDIFLKMFGFAGWNTFGSVALIVRNQGIAVILNLFYGTIVNAAYGVANQITGVLNAIIGTFTQSINPQLMQSKGMDNIKRLQRLSIISSKYSFLLFSLFSVPLIIEMSMVLRIWLGDPPEYTLKMSQLVLCLSMIWIYSNGLMSAIQASGKIASYQATMSLLILLNLPICYVLLSAGGGPYSCLICFIIIETVCLLARMFFAQKLVGIRFMEFLQKVIIPTLSCVFISLIPALLMHYFMSETLMRVFMVSIVYALFYVPSAWKFAMDAYERNVVSDIIINKIRRK